MIEDRVPILIRGVLQASADARGFLAEVSASVR